MRKGSYLRLFGFFAVLFIPSLVTWATFGEVALKHALPVLVAAPFAALVVMALVSGSVWYAEKGGHGAYRVSRAREPFWYWITIGMWFATSLAFLSRYVW